MLNNKLFEIENKLYLLSKSDTQEIQKLQDSNTKKDNKINELTEELGSLSTKFQNMSEYLIRTIPDVDLNDILADSNQNSLDFPFLLDDETDNSRRGSLNSYKSSNSDASCATDMAIFNGKFQYLYHRINNYIITNPINHFIRNSTTSPQLLLSQMETLFNDLMSRLGEKNRTVDNIDALSHSSKYSSKSVRKSVGNENRSLDENLQEDKTIRIKESVYNDTLKLINSQKAEKAENLNHIKRLREELNESKFQINELRQIKTLASTLFKNSDPNKWKSIMNERTKNASTNELLFSVSKYIERFDETFKNENNNKINELRDSLKLTIMPLLQTAQINNKREKLTKEIYKGISEKILLLSKTMINSEDIKNENFLSKAYDYIKSNVDSISNAISNVE